MIFRQSRTNAQEWLDQAFLSADAIEANLSDLALINRRLGGVESVLAHVRPVLKSFSADRPCAVLDVACGAGDMLRAVAESAREQDRAVHAVGLDINPRVIDYARRGMTRCHRRPECDSARSPIQWVLGDVRALPFRTGSFDLVICSCFLHHLAPESAAEFLHSAANLTRGTLIVSDLVRSGLGSAGFRAWARLMRLHIVTRHDGAISLRRAYRPRELDEIAAAAGLRHRRIHRHRFCRMTLVSHPGVA